MDDRPPSFDKPFLIDRRRFLLGVVGGAGALALGGCSGSGSAPSGGGRPTLRIAAGALGFPTPFASNGGPGYNQMSLIFDTLLWKDGSGELLPWLAKSHRSSEDHLTYTFELRDNVRWSDGRPFTADDVAFTYNYYAEQEQLSPPVIIQPPTGIAKVVATGPHTVEFTLERPRVTFLAEVAGAVPIVPKHVWESIKEPADALDPKKHLVGTGPYRLDSYNDDGGAMLYTARDNYFLGAPYVRRIEMNPLSDQFAALLKGESDVARGFGVRDDILAPFQRDGAYGMVTELGSFVTASMYWNLGKPGALADVRFRRACVMAIDRKDLVTRLSAGKGAPGNPGFLSPKNPWYVPVQQYDYDVAGANALLDAAGYKPGAGGAPRQGPDGKPLSFELRYDNVEAVPLSEIVIPALRRIGVEARSKPATLGPELFGPKLFGGYEMAVLPYPGPAPGGLNSDPDMLRRLFSSKVAAYSLTAASSHKNPTFDELADRQLVTFDEAERRRIVAQMQQIIADDLAILPLWYPEMAVVFRKRVLDQWYFTPGQFPTAEDNKQLFITGRKSGTEIRKN